MLNSAKDTVDELIGALDGAFATMKVFISWSGERSHAIAKALHDWLPSVIQTVETWISDEDIDKGARWSTKLAAELEQTQVGIICLTPDNLNAPWLLFESGALSKIQQNTYVCTLLFELEPADLQGPLAQFQSTKAQKEDVRKLIHTINKAQGDMAIPVRQIDIAFERGWNELDLSIQHVPTLQVDSKAKRSDSDMIEEILGLMRAHARIEQTNFNDSRLVEFRLPSGVNLTVEDVELLSNYCRTLQIEQQSLSKQIERLRTDEQYVLECLRMFRDRETKYFDKEWPSKPLLRKFT